jgi:hypothetical protein
MADDIEMIPLEEDEDDGREELIATHLEIMAKADKAGIKYEKREDVLILHLPCGREKRNYFIRGLANAKVIAGIEIEKYSYVESYRGIFDKTINQVEILLRTIDATRLPSHLQYRKLFDVAPNENTPYNPIVVDDPSSGIEISVGPASEEIVILTNSPRITGRPQVSIRINGIKKTSGEYFLEKINKLSNSLFFQIDLLKNIPLTLVRHIDVNQFRSVPKSASSTHIQFPNHEYDHAPLALYFYGRSAGGMPLLRFQAYYQVLEFYFPFYSQMEAKKIIQSNLKDPSFRYDRDSDIVKIISALRTNNYSGFGDEKTQLRVLTNECLNNDDAKSFVNGNENLSDYYKTSYKTLSKQKVGFDSPDSDVRNDLADRIYDIRCKIVHSKGAAKDGKPDFILPFSKESDLLLYDISLIEYVAQRALVFGGVRISI